MRRFILSPWFSRLFIVSTAIYFWVALAKKIGPMPGALYDALGYFILPGAVCYFMYHARRWAAGDQKSRPKILAVVDGAVLFGTFLAIDTIYRSF